MPIDPWFLLQGLGIAAIGVGFWVAGVVVAEYLFRRYKGGDDGEE